jgi:hypothetical protein
MPLWFAQIIVAAAASYFLLLGGVALLKPSYASGFLRGFADSAAKHYLELALRILVGLALIALAAHTPAASALLIVGWILVGTTLVLLLLPWRIHHRFTQSSVPRALQFLPLIGLSSLAIAMWLGWAVVMSVMS